jgi:CDP-glucose 4,6-dehydratase
LWESPEHAVGWNFGPTDEDAQPVGWIVQRLSELWPQELRWNLDEGPHPHEARYLKLDSSRARAHLGWQPPVALELALTSIIDWYQGLHRAADMRGLTLGQIETFQYAGGAR